MIEIAVVFVLFFVLETWILRRRDREKFGGNNKKKRK
jgi:hypothetical protein